MTVVCESIKFNILIHLHYNV